MRSVTWWIVGALGGCAGAPEAAPNVETRTAVADAAGSARERPAEAPAPAMADRPPAAAPATETETETEAIGGAAPEEAETREWRRWLLALADGKRWAEIRLREEVATGTRGAAAAEALGRWLGHPQQERYPDALLVIDAYRDRVAPAPPPVALLALRGELLRDLSQTEAAERQLAALAGANPAALLPEHWLSLAELCQLRGARAEALEYLDQGEAAWVGRPEWSRLAPVFAALRAESGSDGVPVRDLLAVLRGHDDPAERTAALTLLGRAEGELALQAVALALDDPDPDVRSLAIRALPAASPGRTEVVAVALMDRNREVRMAGARAARSLPAADRDRLLAPALAQEADPVVADSMRRALEGDPAAGADRRRNR